MAAVLLPEIEVALDHAADIASNDTLVQEFVEASPFCVDQRQPRLFDPAARPSVRRMTSSAGSTLVNSTRWSAPMRRTISRRAGTLSTTIVGVVPRHETCDAMLRRRSNSRL